MAKCDACDYDARVIEDWRKMGGPLPPKTCTREHGKVCRQCGQVLTRNPSKRCDDCFNEWWKNTIGFVVQPESTRPDIEDQ